MTITVIAFSPHMCHTLATMTQGAAVRMWFLGCTRSMRCYSKLALKPLWVGDRKEEVC
jgi:hypothetical protein